MHLLRLNQSYPFDKHFIPCNVYPFIVRAYHFQKFKSFLSLQFLKACNWMHLHVTLLISNPQDFRFGYWIFGRYSTKLLSLEWQIQLFVRCLLCHIVLLPFKAFSNGGCHIWKGFPDSRTIERLTWMRITNASNK